MSDGTVQVLPKKETDVPSLIKPASWTKTIDFIKRLISNNNILISILGEEKSGKTVFATLLKASIKEGTKSFLIAAKPDFKKANFLKQLSTLVGAEKSTSLFDIFNSFNTHQSKTLIIIDDAQYVSEDFIEELLSELKKQGQNNSIFVCLISDFSLVVVLNKLAKNAFRDMIHSIEMPPFNEDESNTYVAQNLFKTYHRKTIPATALKQFYQMTGGHLAHINRQLPMFLNDRLHSIVKKRRKGTWFNQIAIATVVFLAIIGIAYLTEPEMHDTIQAQQESRLKQVEVEIEPILSSYIPAYQVSATRHLLASTSIKREEIKIVKNKEEDQGINDAIALIDKVLVAPKVLPHPQKTAMHVESIKTVKKIEAAFPVKSKAGFTIQLIATHNKRKLQQFISDHQLKGKTEIHRTQRAGKDWYVLTIGDYPRQQLAKQAAHQLPKEVTQFKPWVRQLSEIKDVG